MTETAPTARPRRAGMPPPRSAWRDMGAGFLGAAVILALFVLAGSGPARAQERSVLSTLARHNAPVIEHDLRQWIKRIERMDGTEEPKRVLGMANRLVRRYPHLAEPRYLYAVRLAGMGGAEEQILMVLESAVARGFRDVPRLQAEPAFAALRDRPRFHDLIAAAGAPAVQDPRPFEPGRRPIKDGIALVGERNTGFDRRLKTLKALFLFDSDQSDSAVVRAIDAPHADLLNDWYAEGRAAGNHGDLYDNRDFDHASLRPERFPQVAFVEYSDIAHAAGVHQGLGVALMFDHVTVGNASTVRTGVLGRSHPRDAMTRPGVPDKLYRQYRSDHLYVYPGHRDHDLRQGDLFPANMPYLIASHGSSRSDKPFVAAALDILAAFRPDVKAYLRANRLLMPTVQMILRRGQTFVDDDADYLSGRAHPSAFEAEHLDRAKMVTLANGLTVDRVPPMVHLDVVNESRPRPGIEAFGPEVSETLFTTPAAIARVVRGTTHEKRMVISAANTQNLDDTPLRFEWVVLRGDAERIRIVPKDDRASRVEIVVPWHGRRPVPGHPELTTDRVDIGVFTRRGGIWSAPSFVSFVYPPNQKRDYAADGRLLSVDYRAPDLADRAVDPVLFHARRWSDVYDYDADGHLLGWRRWGLGPEQRFTRHGARVEEVDPLGRPLTARQIVYRYVEEDRREINKGTPKEIEAVPGDATLTYRYDGPDDHLGTLVDNGGG